MAKRRVCTWPMVAAALLSGCAIGRLGSYSAVSPVELGAAKEVAAPRPPTSGEIETIWGELAAENPALADRAAGEEIVIRHVYGEPEPIDWENVTPLGKAIVLVGLAFCVWLLIDVMSYDTTY